jgi:hypothetical protein
MSKVSSPLHSPPIPAGAWNGNGKDAADGGSVLSGASSGEFLRVLGSLEDVVMAGPPRFPREEENPESRQKRSVDLKMTPMNGVRPGRQNGRRQKGGKGFPFPLGQRIRGK